jgi:hypothetical protein
VPTSYVPLQSIFANVCWYVVASWSSAELSWSLAEPADRLVPRSEATVRTCALNSWFALETAFFLDSARSPRASAICERSSRIVRRLVLIWSVVAVVGVRPFSVLTCFSMPARESQT